MRLLILTGLLTTLFHAKTKMIAYHFVNMTLKIEILYGRIKYILLLVQVYSPQIWLMIVLARKKLVCSIFIPVQWKSIDVV